MGWPKTLGVWPVKSLSKWGRGVELGGWSALARPNTVIQMRPCFLLGRLGQTVSTKFKRPKEKQQGLRTPSCLMEAETQKGLKMEVRSRLTGCLRSDP